MTDADALEPRLLRSFVAVAEELHFGRAARRLHISQPPLSMQIRTLEERLGARLLERDRRHVALTEAGAFFLERARTVLGDGARIRGEVRRIARGESGALAVGYTPTATYEVLPVLLTAHRAARPDVRLELVELASPQQPEALRTGRIEVGLACGPVDALGITARVLREERFVAALPRRHALAKLTAVPLRRLAGEPFVAVRPDVEPAWAGACERALLRARVRLEVVQETDSKIALLGLVAARVGCAIVSESMRHLARDGVVYRDIVGLDVRVPLVGLLTDSPSPRARAFFDAAI
ncbi:MAG: LysR substrate-binding domain-containing protein [Polyangiaceae bacterium]